MTHLNFGNLELLVAVKHHHAEEGERHDAGHEAKMQGDERHVIRLDQLLFWFVSFLFFIL